MEERARRFRAEVAVLNGDRDGRRTFSDELRAEALEYMSSRRKQGASFGQITLELGLGASTLDKWRCGQTRFRRVVAKEGLPQARRSVCAGKVSVQTASGLRIEGLALSEVIELAKALA